MTEVKKRSVDIAGHRTSVSIEAPFWDALRDIAVRQNTSVNALISEVDNAREGNLSSALRVYVLCEIQKLARQ
jgi:predicted DNA-binding ribbon-helix-helix protein